MKNFVLQGLIILFQIYPLYSLLVLIIFTDYDADWIFMKYTDIILFVFYCIMLAYHLIYNGKVDLDRKKKQYINLGWILRTIIVLLILYQQLVIFILDTTIDLNLINMFLSAAIIIPFEYSIIDAYKLKQLLRQYNKLDLFIDILILHETFYILITQLYLTQYFMESPQIIISIITSIYLINTFRLEFLKSEFNFNIRNYLLIAQGVVNLIDLILYYQVQRTRLQYIYVLSLLNLINLLNLKESEKSLSQSISDYLTENKSNQSSCQSCKQSFNLNDSICYYSYCTHILHESCQHSRMCKNVTFTVHHEQAQKQKYKINLNIWKHFQKYYPNQQIFILMILLAVIIIQLILLPYNFIPEINQKGFIPFVILPQIFCFYAKFFIISKIYTDISMGSIIKINKQQIQIQMRVVMIMIGIIMSSPLAYYFVIQYYFFFSDKLLEFYALRLFFTIINIIYVAQYMFYQIAPFTNLKDIILVCFMLQIFTEIIWSIILQNIFYDFSNATLGIIESMLIILTSFFVQICMNKQVDRTFKFITQLCLISYSITFTSIFDFSKIENNQIYFLFQLNLTIFLLGKLLTIYNKDYRYQRYKFLESQTNNLDLLLYRGFQLKTYFVCFICEKIQYKGQLFIYFTFCQHTYHKNCMKGKNIDGCLICQQVNRFDNFINPSIQLTLQ